MKKNYGQKQYYKRKYRQKYNKSKFGTYVKTAGNIAKVASTALTIAKGVAAIVNAEHKYIQTELNSFNVDNTNWIAGCLNLCAEGDDYNNRNGRSIKVKNLRLRFTVQGQSAFNAGVGRLVIVRDIGAQGVIQPGNEIFTNPTFANNRVYSMRNIADGAFKRYQILKDIRFTLDQSNNRIDSIDITIPINKHSYYIGTSSLPTDIGSGAIHYYFTCTGTTTTNTAMIVNLLARLYFVDN